jgi:hypothetical protein
VPQLPFSPFSSVNGGVEKQDLVNLSAFLQGSSKLPHLVVYLCRPALVYTTSYVDGTWVYILCRDLLSCLVFSFRTPSSNPLCRPVTVLCTRVRALDQQTSINLTQLPRLRLQRKEGCTAIRSRLVLAKACVENCDFNLILALHLTGRSSFSIQRRTHI